MLKINEMSDGSYVCGVHANKAVRLMVSNVGYTAGCEECTRRAFAEALKRALAEQGIYESSKEDR